MKLSIIILMYNSKWEKLKATVMSVILQKNKSYEIIFADDGSKDNHKERLISLMAENKIENYKFAILQTNGGTVRNVCNALKYSSGGYVKLLSPGDFLYDEDTLDELLKFAEKSQADAIFGDAIYYSNDDGKISKVDEINSPANVTIYDSAARYNVRFVDCLLGNDCILGASVLVRSDIIKSYIESMVSKVKYAEDTMIRLMLFDHKDIVHFKHPIIWYEYGSGISTSKSEKWSRIIKADYDAADELIRLEHAPSGKIEKRYLRYLTNCGKYGKLRKILKCAMFPSVLLLRFRMRKFPQHTSMLGNVEYVNKLFNY